MQRIFRHYSRGQSIFQVFLPLRRLMTQSHLGKPLMWIEQGFFLFSSLLDFLDRLLILPARRRPNQAAIAHAQKGTKTGGALLALLLHQCGEKRTFQEISHFLPAASWLQRGCCPHTWLAVEPLWPGAGSWKQTNEKTEERRREERRGGEGKGDCWELEKITRLEKTKLNHKHTEDTKWEGLESHV